ncbi:unnamed protein product, partial [Choristocarpus tenellus]
QFFFGRGEKPDLKKAFKAYSWAAERGFPEAMHMLAWMYRVGSFVEADMEKCQHWLQLAAEKSYAPAMNFLALILLSEADWLEEQNPEVKADPRCPMGDIDTAESGEGEGAEEKAGTNDEGEEGIDLQAEVTGNTRVDDRRCQLGPDLLLVFEQVMEKRRKAMRLLQGASRTGHTEAMTNLGNMQEAMGYLGDACNWYRLAADPTDAANNPRAQNYLGVMYLEGRGLVRNTTEAVKWFVRSSRQGDPQGCRNMGMCYEGGVGVPKDIHKAMEFYRLAAEGYSIPAVHSLAYLLARDALHKLASTTQQAP